MRPLLANQRALVRQRDWFDARSSQEGAGEFAGQEWQFKRNDQEDEETSRGASVEPTERIVRRRRIHREVVDSESAGSLDALGRGRKWNDSSRS